MSHITIVVPTYDRPDMLAETLRSLERLETDASFTYDIVVVDNGSQPDTRACVQRCTPTPPTAVRYVREERGGVSYARNRGVEEATGDWVAFCDDDQTADRRWLVELYRAAAIHRAACVGGAILLRLPSGSRRVGPLCRRMLGEQPFSGEAFVCTGSDIPSSGNLMVARHQFRQVGSFDAGMTAGGEDCEFVRRIRRLGGTVVIAPAAVVYHTIPEYRLTSAYLEWVSLRMGAGLAYTDAKERGRTAALSRAVARIGQAALVTVPRLLRAWLRADPDAVLDQRTLLWRANGYMRCAALLVGSNGFAGSAFGRRVEFRRERATFAGQRRSP